MNVKHCIFSVEILEEKKHTNRSRERQRERAKASDLIPNNSNLIENQMLPVSIIIRVGGKKAFVYSHW